MKNTEISKFLSPKFKPLTFEHFTDQFRQDRSLQVSSEQVISVQARVVKSGQVSLYKKSHVCLVMSGKNSGQIWSIKSGWSCYVRSGQVCSGRSC